MEREVLTVPSLPPGRCCCFTGHRRISEDELRLALPALCGRVNELYRGGVVRFYAGGAVGFDMAASIAVINMKYDHPALSLVLALPCREHDRLWEQKYRVQLAAVIRRADGVVYVTDGPYESGCMQKRDRYMVENSSVCLAWYDGRRYGGTEYTLRYARRAGLDIINLNQVIYNK